MPPIASLECSRCHAQLSAQSPQTLCTQCSDQPGGALSVRCDLSHLGVFPARLLSPEGASVTAAYDRLLANGYLKSSGRVLLFNTGAGLKYADVIADAMHLSRPMEEAKIHA